MRDLVHLFDRESGLGEAVGDRASGEVTGMLAPDDPLLRDARDHGAIHDQHGGRIVALRNSILSLVEVRPMRALERD